MLVPLPIGLWIFSLVSDVIYLAGGNPAWATASWYTMAGGIIGAIAAAVPGFLDYLAMSPSRVKDIAYRHMLLNVAALVLFTINFFVRDGGVGAGTFVLSIIGVLGIVLSGWLGGHMVYVHGMAVDETEVCEHGDLTHSHARR
jgi:uncharacterized membrane protein